ncbi:glycoside hydrolase superfamily [Mycena vitilis]|nr:glycoside hydrolase superfamily [Mycena vitilis]
MTHLIYSYATVAADGTVSLTAAQQAQVKTMLSMKGIESGLKIMIGVGGWGFGADKTNFIAMAQSTASQSQFANTVASLLKGLGADGIDIEWPVCQTSTSCVTPAQFGSLASTTKSVVGASLVSVQLPFDFWNMAGAGAAMPTIGSNVEWISLLTTYSGAVVMNGLEEFETILELARLRSTDIPSSMYLYSVPFYSRNIQSTELVCIVGQSRTRNIPLLRG